MPGLATEGESAKRKEPPTENAVNDHRNVRLRSSAPSQEQNLLVNYNEQLTFKLKVLAHLPPGVDFFEETLQDIIKLSMGLQELDWTFAQQILNRLSECGATEDKVVAAQTLLQANVDKTSLKHIGSRIKTTVDLKNGIFAMADAYLTSRSTNTPLDRQQILHELLSENIALQHTLKQGREEQTQAQKAYRPDAVKQKPVLSTQDADNGPSVSARQPMVPASYTLQSVDSNKSELGVSSSRPTDFSSNTISTERKQAQKSTELQDIPTNGSAQSNLPLAANDTKYGPDNQGINPKETKRTQTNETLEVSKTGPPLEMQTTARLEGQSSRDSRSKCGVPLTLIKSKSASNGMRGGLPAVNTPGLGSPNTQKDAVGREEGIAGNGTHKNEQKAAAATKDQAKMIAQLDQLITEEREKAENSIKQTSSGSLPTPQSGQPDSSHSPNTLFLSLERQLEKDHATRTPLKPNTESKVAFQNSSYPLSENTNGSHFDKGEGRDRVVSKGHTTGKPMTCHYW